MFSQKLVLFKGYCSPIQETITTVYPFISMNLSKELHFWDTFTILNPETDKIEHF